MLLLQQVGLLGEPAGLKVQDNEVPSVHVESREMLTGVLRVVDVLVDHVGGPLGLFCVSDADLPNCTVLSKELKQLVA